MREDLTGIMKGLDATSSRQIERKQSDLDSGLEMELQEEGKGLRTQLLILASQNSKLLSKLALLKLENKKLMDDLKSKSQTLNAANLQISSLTLMLKKREATYQELFDKYASFCSIIGKCNINSWALDVIKNLIEKAESDSKNSEECESIRYFISLLEESLIKMDKTLRQEAAWKSDAEREIKKLHIELSDLLSVNKKLKEALHWYEIKTSNLENSLEQRLRNVECLQENVSALSEEKEKLSVQINERTKRHRRKKKKNIAFEATTELTSVHNMPDQTMDGKPYSAAKSENLSINNSEKVYVEELLKEERNKNSLLQSEFEKLGEEFSELQKEKNTLETRVNNLETLKKSFVNLAIKHKKSIDRKRKCIAEFKNTIMKLKRLKRSIGVNFIQQILDHKLLLSYTINGSSHFCDFLQNPSNKMCVSSFSLPFSDNSSLSSNEVMKTDYDGQGNDAIFPATENSDTALSS